MSSTKAIYESSMVCGFGADEKFDASSFKVESAGLGAATAAESGGFGFPLGAAVSLLTRTDAGTIAVSSGVC